MYELPQAGRAARGKPIVNLLPLDAGERINAILPIREFDQDHYVFMATANGTVKKTALSNFARPRASGLIAVDLREGDYLVNVAITDGSRDVMLFSNAGTGWLDGEDIPSLGFDIGAGIELGSVGFYGAKALGDDGDDPVRWTLRIERRF